jgi:hypothetical protein
MPRGWYRASGLSSFAVAPAAGKFTDFAGRPVLGFALGAPI